MKKPTRAQLRNAGFKVQPLKPVAIRLAPDTWEKIDWLAAEAGIPRADFVRRLLGNAASKARPPKAYEKREIRVTADEWEQLTAVAVTRGHETAGGMLAELSRALIANHKPAA